LKRAVVCVVAGSGISSASLIKQLAPLHSEIQQPIDFISLAENSIATALPPETSLVIIDQPWHSAENVESIETVRGTGYKGPVILIISDIGRWASRVRMMPILKGVGFATRPVDPEELIGLVKRVILTEGRRFRVFPRHAIELQAELRAELEVPLGITEKNDHQEEPEFGQKIECTILNVSHGGACLRFDSGLRVAVNALVELNFRLDDEMAVQNIRCRVAWVRPDAGLAGAEFMHTLEL